MKKIIVTGGLGFIGSNLIELLLKRNYQVINIDKNMDINIDKSIDMIIIIPLGGIGSRYKKMDIINQKH